MAIFEKGKANVIIDAQWGSCGKGKLAGYLCQTEKPDLVVCDYMPNAGHVYVDDDGHATTFCQIPVGALFGIDCLIGPHAAIDVDLLFAEMEKASSVRLWIHPLATVVTETDRLEEKSVGARIANTAKGGHSAGSKKAMRSNDARLAQDDHRLKPFISDTHAHAQDVLKKGGTVFIETAQGFDLGLNHGHRYPYVTGRDCLIGRVLDNAGLPVQSVGSIVACFRTFPIRVGNTDQGNSGPYYSDQQELSWEQLAEMTGVKMKPEKTTVTKRTRRVFTFSWLQAERFINYVQPTHAFLNFVNYLRDGQNDEFVGHLTQWLNDKDCNLKLLGTGARNGEMVLLP